jgi:formylglycine-generating enzyme required for sulfatase activity
MRGSPTDEPGHNAKEEPVHKVNLNAFNMSEVLVTQEVYEAVMKNNPSNFKNPVAGETETPRKLPVERASGYDAIVFCNKLSMLEGLSPAYRINKSTNPADWGNAPASQNATWDAVEVVSGSNGYRLPTEAQWEYACRAGTTTAFYTGSVFTDSTGWYVNNSENKTHKVGTKPANAWGLYDMHGNVFEWCWDRFDYYLSGEANNPTGPIKGNNRILRGGSYGASAETVRSAFRVGEYPYTRYYPYGFRLVLP